MADGRPARRLVRRGIEESAPEVEIAFAGQSVRALEGESLAAALTAAGIVGLRTTRRGEPRGVFCGMGVCFDCLVRIDGRPSQRACLTKVRAGMRIEPQLHEGPVPDPGDPPLAAAPNGGIPEHECEVLVIGAGPAGLAAAEAAASSGAEVTVLDERPEPGGQYFKQLAPSHRFAAPSAIDRQFARGRALIDRVRELGVCLVGEAMVWGAFRGEDGTLELGTFADGRAGRYRTRHLIVAVGAYERSFPVPGWTLPGVMTTGAAQTLGRSYRVAPGSRVLFAGNGPLNLQVAAELASGGARVVAVAEAAPRPGPSRLGSLMSALRWSPDLMRDGLLYLAALWRHRIPVLYRHAVVRLDGNGRVERATLARIDAEGRPIPGTERPYDVDSVCLGYGFLPSTDITRLLGCRHVVDPSAALAVERDLDGATSVPGVFAAGDCGGIGGARVALAQGKLAGLAAARNLGHASPAPAAIARAQAELAQALAFQNALWRLFAAPRVDGIVDDEVVICRCEEVTAGHLRRYRAAGAAESGAIKKLTRTGMGRCQGRYCAPHVARMCAAASGRAPDEFAFFAPRVPVKALPAVALASEKGEWAGHGETEPPPLGAPLAVRDEAERRADTAIIGAGILGTCTAYYLARAGADVVVLERGQPNGQASGGNAGSLHVQLLSYDFGERAEGGGRMAAQALPLQRESARAWPALAKELGRDVEIEVTGGLMVAEDEARLDHLKRKAALERSFGTSVEVISASELKALAPAVSWHMIGAAWCAEEGKINPMLATQAVLEAAMAAGARLFRETEVRAIERTGGGFLLHTNRGAFRAARVLNAAGAWSSRVAAMVGVRLPVHASPLQMIVTEPAPLLVRHLIAHADRHLTLKQARNGNIIIGGGWRARLDASGHALVQCDSLEGNLWVAQRVLPALASVHVIRAWAAINASIDGAPILGEVPGLAGFYNAVAGNGVTLGPIIGRLTADMMRSGRADPALAPFSLARFG
ncbi:MAG: FAD-dependent oxidoreductase [Pseudomonadota bacterium]